MGEDEFTENRSELLFLYDCRDANPNGDPLDENKPRIDEETGINIVTDVRLKRTIRDYFLSKNIDVFVKEEIGQTGQKTREERVGKDTEESLLKKYIDLRLFGATILTQDQGENNGGSSPRSSKGTSIVLTGPVQFKFGRSLHKVSGPVLIKGTTVMPSRAGKEQGTFTETWILPYSLIAFYGIINENAAKSTHLTEKDIKLLLEGMWNGTKNLISRSKVGQNPRLLLRIVYKKNNNFHIGDLDKKIKIKSNKRDEEIRGIHDVTLDLSDLLSALEREKDKIEKIEYKVCPDPECSSIEQELNKLKSNKLSVKWEELNFEN